jgi:stage V sporulation protein S
LKNKKRKNEMQENTERNESTEGRTENKKREGYEIRISSKTNAKAAAGSLAMILKDYGFAEMTAIGAASVNQAVKAFTISKGHVAPMGADIILIPAFETAHIDGKETTRMRFRIEPR